MARSQTKSHIKRYKPYNNARTGVGIAAALAQLAGGIRPSFNTLQGPQNSRDAAGNALTQYHDIDRAYYKRRYKKNSKRSKKAKKKYRKWKKKVKAAVSGGSPTFHYNERCSALVSMPVMPTIWSTSPSQQILGMDGTDTYKTCFRLFGGLPVNTGSFVAALATDVGRYLANGPGTINTRYNGGDLSVPAKTWLETFYAYIKHSAITFTIVNTQAVAINVDIYEFTPTRAITYNDLYSTPRQAMNRISSTDATNLSVNMTNTINITDFGATPWDFPGLSKSWKVLSKTTIYLPANGQTALSFKGPKGMWGGPRMNEFCALKGKTRDYVFIVGSKIGAGMDGVTPPIKVAWEKTYKIKPPAGQTWTTDGILSAQSYAY